MATHDPATNTYTLLDDELDFILQPLDGDANVIGNDQGNEITGNDGENTLEGRGGNDSLLGGLGNDHLLGGDDNDTLDGGDGDDQLEGGKGDDTYIVDGSETITELADAGNDTVIVAISMNYTIVGTEIENIVLADGGWAFGNDYANRLTGGDNSHDKLDGGKGDDTLDGGQGGDTLIGGEGNDTYYVDHVSDIVDEQANQGNDRILSYISFDLGLNGANVEYLELLGTADINGTGRDLADEIVGNDGNNVLEGLGGNDTLDGGAGDDTLIGGAGADSLMGGKGDDIYVVDAEDIINEGDDEGHDTVLAGSDFTLGNNIEDLTLTGTGDFDGVGNEIGNVITGNDGDNTLNGLGGNDSLLGGLGDDRLFGGEGNDTLVGGDGMDQLAGGLGDDTYFVDADDNKINEDADQGTDTVIVTVEMDYTIIGTAVENIVLMAGGSATGNGLGNHLIGSNSKDDILDGGKGNDTLDGGGGADIMSGGEDNDTYYVYSDLDIIHEFDGEGDDRILSYIGFNLGLKGAHVEHLELLGTANINGTGRDLADEIVGNDGNNILEGLGGNDTLDGGVGNDTLNGGAGADDLSGGKGDDTYIIDAADILREEKDEGRDTILVGLSTYTLGSNFEDLTFTGTGNFSGTGNEHHNFIRGNNGNDLLVGHAGDDSLHGGVGADRMDGGAGSDLYWVDNAGDVIVDSGVGFDRVLASTNYTLSANLEYLAFEGTGNFVGTGNELDNYLYGNTGANTLDGGAGRDQIDGGEGNDSLLGGAGDDTITDFKGDDVIDGGAGKDDLRGGVGNDTYVVDALDLVTELAGQGTDTVTASESFSLSAAAEVEFLIAKAGTKAIDLTGSDIANTISGNNGANILAGGKGDDALKGLLGRDVLSGGAGNDRLSGGDGKDVLRGDAGNDTFVFDTRIAKANTDKVAAYSVAEDRIFIENSLLKANKALYKTISKGTEAKPAKLAKKFFTIGSKAKDKDDFFVLDKKKYTLYYDADGSGSKAAIAIATFDKKAMKKFIHKELFFI